MSSVRHRFFPMVFAQLPLIALVILKKQHQVRIKTFVVKTVAKTLQKYRFVCQQIILRHLHYCLVMCVLGPTLEGSRYVRPIVFVSRLNQRVFMLE